MTDVFGSTLQIYQDYYDILLVYKKTKFMQELYSDIRANVQKIKVILTQELENLRHNPSLDGGMLYDILRFLILIVQTQYQSSAPENDKEGQELAQMKNTAVLNFLKTFQQINQKQLENKLSKLASIKLVSSPMLREFDLQQLIEMPLSDIAEASSPIWFVKSLVSNVITSFLKPMLSEYQRVFKDVCRSSQSLTSIYITFFAQIIKPVSQLATNYLCTKGCFKEVQASIFLLLNSYADLGQ